jgi:hypothetical protein
MAATLIQNGKIDVNYVGGPDRKYVVKKYKSSFPYV